MNDLYDDTDPLLFNFNHDFGGIFEEPKEDLFKNHF